MQGFASVRDVITASIQKLVRGDASAERRQAFRAEFGFFPLASGAAKSEQAIFADESIRPVLQQRANVIHLLSQEAADTAMQSVTDASRHEKQASFNRAYRLAADLHLAEKGLSYQDFISEMYRSQVCQGVH